MTRLQLAVLGGALALHLGAYIVFGVIPKARKQSSVAIALAEAKKKDDQDKEKKKPPKPPEKEKDKTPAAKTKPAPKPTPIDAPPPQNNTPPPPSSNAGDSAGSLDGFADLGLTMGGGSGMAVPARGGGGSGNGNGGHAAPASTTEQIKQLSGTDPGCTEDLVKAKPENRVEGVYPPTAQQADVEGKVKLELTLDASGHVIAVKVLNGLGFGCDEAAGAAAKQWTFAPATKCGKAVPSTFKLGMSFGLR